MNRFSEAAQEARTSTPRGVSAREGWWIVALAVVLGVSHAFLYQSHAFGWGGILRFVVLWLTIVAITWASLQRHVAERVHPTGHRRLLVLAGAWALLVVLVAGWFWIVPAGGHEVGWLPTGLVAAVGVLPLALVGLRLVRAGSEAA